MVYINKRAGIRGITHATLAPWLERLLTEEGRGGAEVSLTFLNSREMSALNEQYTGRTGTTDVLAFAQQEEEPHAPDTNLLGDVVVDVDRVRNQARDYGTPLAEEFLRVVAHGFLHILGYRHTESAEAERMREAENRYIDLYFALGSEKP